MKKRSYFHYFVFLLIQILFILVPRSDEKLRNNCVVLLAKNIFIYTIFVSIFHIFPFDERWTKSCNKI